MVIHDCIKSIEKDMKIIVVENSDNSQFKEELESTYKNVSCVLTSQNLGMGAGNNIGIKKAKTDFVLILNPDVILDESTINELIVASRKITNFAILAPISTDTNHPNYRLLKNKKTWTKDETLFKVKSVDGFAMLFNKKKLDKVITNNYFDENFFMYLENDDLCKRITENRGDIFVTPKAKINHLGAKAVNEKYRDEVEFSRNWHWMWSKFYFNKKHYGLSRALIEGLPQFLLSALRLLFFKITKNKNKQKIYFNRASGFFNALIGKPSWYRPKLD